MLVKKFSWELDPYGTNDANLITDELQTITAGNGGDFFFFIPKAAPYYAKGAKLVHVASGRELEEGVDWEPSYLFELVSKRTYMPVYGGVSILDTSLTGVFKFTYHTLGGEYTLDTASVIELLSNAITDPRTTTWESITGVPWYFTPIEHRFDVADTVGASELAEKLTEVADAVKESADKIFPSIGAHVEDLENPHQVTKAQVGLSEVSNFPMATQAEADAGTRLDRYVSVGLVRRMISLLGGGGGGASSAHILDTNNPHQVTKAQVGLGNVDNFATATQVDAEAGTSNSLFMTPVRVAQAIAKLVGDAFTNHAGNSDNPHQVTKAQVGLGNVDNYTTASQAEAEAGTSNSVFMTPVRVAQAITKLAGNVFSAHVADTGNPHQVTKTQIGLGDVDNFPTADDDAAINKDNDSSFLTPKKAWLAVQSWVATALEAHISNSDNPHQVTKDQVGLGSVDNYQTATQEEAEAGVATNRFMTPQGVFQAITKAVSELTSHITNKQNPHQVTKAQVGLGNVENYPMATAEQALLGVSRELYISPADVAAMIGNIVGDGVLSHINNTNNPHQTTAEQVGLGLVDNFATATQEETVTGTAQDLFVTPVGVKAALDSRVASQNDVMAGISQTGFVNPATLKAVLNSYLGQTPLYSDTTVGSFANLRIMAAGVDVTLPSAGEGAVGGGLIRVTIDHVVTTGVNLLCTSTPIVNPNYSANSVTLNTVGKEFVLAAVQHQGAWAWRISSVS